MRVSCCRSKEVKVPEQGYASTQHQQGVQGANVEELVGPVAAVLGTVALFPVDAVLVVAPVAAPVDTTLRDLGAAPLYTPPPAVPDEAPGSLHDALVAEGAKGLGLLAQTLNSRVLGLVVVSICSTVVLPFSILTGTALVALDGMRLVETRQENARPC